MKMNENHSIDPNAMKAMMRECIEREICTYVHDELMEEFGQAPSVEELIKHFNGEPVDIPDFTAEQKACAFFLMVKFSVLRSIAVRELANTTGAMDDDCYAMGDAWCEEGDDDDMADEE